MASSRPGLLLSALKKQISSSNIAMTRTIDYEPVVDSDTDDYIDESANDDDDDSSDWEDSMEESDKSSMVNAHCLILIQMIHKLRRSR
ncbi:uncharacterized protein FFNC_15371 [Fusarium fujikuroi]|nr:uncharacterized protein FFNC_15371 [Fusarium fujikuroi]